MRIVKLEAENYKRLKAVQITPGGNVVVIGGKNAAGKTSVLDAIWSALAGGEASRATVQPIRDGQSQAVVRLDLGDYIVTRKWTKDDAGTLTIEAPDGARYSSPQKLLDEVVGARAFDPLAFTRMAGRDQLKALLSTVELGIDPDQLEAERKGVFDRRTEINRDVKRLEAQLAGFALPDESLPADEVPAARVLAEAEDAREQNAARSSAQVSVVRLTEEVATLRKGLEAASAALAEATADLAAMPPVVDVDAITARLAELEQTNARVREQRQRASVAEELAERKNLAAAHTLQLRNIEKRKADALAAVEFPVPGLGFDDTGVTFNGIPFSQASAAEQLRVSVALAMAANPTLRVLRILDGSLLDEDSLALIEELAKENDYQIFLETVGDHGMGVIIEDGTVSHVYEAVPDAVA